MSKHNNVNPGQYKVAGRERQGEHVVVTDHKAQLTQAQPDKKGHLPVTAGTSSGEKKTTRE